MNTTGHAADLFSMTRPAIAAPATQASPRPRGWIPFHAFTEDAATETLTRAGFKVTPIVDKYGVKRWEFVDGHDRAWMLSREKFLKTGWLYS